MAITNKTVRDAQKNIAEDVDLSQKPKRDFTETIAKGLNVRLPNGQWLSPEAQMMLTKSIVARDLSTPLTNMFKIKDYTYYYRLVNRSGGQGILYAKAKALGFVHATPEDAEPLTVEITSDNGQMRVGDLVLMKLPLERWIAHERSRMERTLALQRRTRSYFNKTPNPSIHSDETPTMVDAQSQNMGDGKYLTHYQPDPSELDAKMGADPVAGGK